MKKHILLTVASGTLFLASCAQKHYTYEEHCKPYLGKTKVELLEKFGKPQMTSKTGDQEVLTFSKSDLPIPFIGGKVSSISFLLKNGKVVECSAGGGNF